jgi:hemerythrin-like metal-binding protein
MKTHAVSTERAPATSRIFHEHREVLESLDNFRSAVNLKKPKSRLARDLAEFVATVERHFASEEEMMRTSGYQAVGGHAEEHKRLFAQLQAVRQEFNAGTIHPGGSLALFVEVWTVQHMKGYDKAFIDYLDSIPAAARS